MGYFDAMLLCLLQIFQAKVSCIDVLPFRRVRKSQTLVFLIFGRCENLLHSCLAFSESAKAPNIATSSFRLLRQPPANLHEVKVGKKLEMKNYILFCANQIVCSLDIAFSESSTNFANLSSVSILSDKASIIFNSERAVV